MESSAKIDAECADDQLFLATLEGFILLGAVAARTTRNVSKLACEIRNSDSAEKIGQSGFIDRADPGLEVMHRNAAGIDVGNSAHYVAVRPDRDAEPVRRFACFTADLHRLADWLQQCGVTTVAMQSTGVYWIPLYEILDARGLEVYLVNARHTKNLPGRKTDVQERQWLLKLHTYGLLRNSFHPVAEMRVVRTYWRQRGEHVHAVSTCIQRMQKALTQMNIQLANVISDLSGWTGQRIVRAILAGERDPATLAALRHPGIHATQDTIAKSLEGTWQPDLLFVLQQDVALYDAYQQRIVDAIRHSSST